MKPLKLTETEINKISTIARDRRFRIEKTELIYCKNWIDKGKYFVINCRFLISVIHSLDKEQDAELYQKMYEFALQYSDIYDEILPFVIKLESDVSYGSYTSKSKLTKLIMKYEYEINSLIDNVIPLGKVVSMYNPDEEVGFT